MSTRQRPYTRPRQPIDIRLTERDFLILETLNRYRYMRLSQIDWLFFAGKGTNPAAKRMRKLYHAHMVKMNSAVEAHRIPAEFGSVYRNDKRGIERLARWRGERVTAYNYLKELPKKNLPHNLRERDLRALVERECREDDLLELLNWTKEEDIGGDEVSYTNLFKQRVTKKVIPDSFFMVRQLEKRNKNYPRFAFLVEVDMGEHYGRRFSEEKIIAGMTYLKSQAFRERFGVKFGRWLVPTTSEKRMQNLMRYCRDNGGAKSFYFTTFDKLMPKKRKAPEVGTTLRKSIWFMADREEPTSLINDAFTQSTAFFDVLARATLNLI